MSTRPTLGSKARIERPVAVVAGDEDAPRVYVRGPGNDDLPSAWIATSLAESGLGETLLTTLPPAPKVGSSEPPVAAAAGGTANAAAVPAMAMNVRIFIVPSLFSRPRRGQRISFSCTGGGERGRPFLRVRCWHRTPGGFPGPCGLRVAFIRLGSGEACPTDRELRPRTHVEHAIDLGQVPLDRLGADVQRVGDLLVRAPAGDQTRDRPLGRRQRLGDPRV